MKDDKQSYKGSTTLSGLHALAQPHFEQPMSTFETSGIMLQEEQRHAPHKDQEANLKFAEETHQYIRENIRLADQKATFFFAGSTALLAYLHKLGFASKWTVSPVTWGLTQMLSLLAGAGLLFSAIACLLVVMPRLKGSKRGLIFFGAISEFDSSNDFVGEFMKQDLSELCKIKLRHIYDLSGICSKKYSMLKWGQWLGGLGLIASLLLLVLI